MYAYTCGYYGIWLIGPKYLVTVIVWPNDTVGKCLSQ